MNQAPLGSKDNKDIVKKISKNSLFLYIKVAIAFFVSLISTRLILRALGEVDYGIFNLVGSVIAIFSVLNISMVTATQRFIAYAEGEGNLEKKRSIFNCSIMIHRTIAGFVVGFMAIFLLFFFSKSLNIPTSRMFAAKIVFLFMICSSALAIMTVPYDAMIMAHENMKFISVLGICESISKLIGAIILSLLCFDRLIFWGGSITMISGGILLAKQIYSRKKYCECTISKKSWDCHIFKKMIAFAGWSALYSFSSVISIQGISYLLNIFFGPKLNAARGIGNMMSGEAMLLCGTTMLAITPVITKFAGEQNGPMFRKYTLTGCKVSGYLTALVGLPLILEAPTILRVWLSNVPSYTVGFCQYSILEQIIAAFSIPLVTAINANGNIRNFQILVSITYILRLPIVYLLYQDGYSPIACYYISILMIAIMCLIRIYFSYKLCGISVKSYSVCFFKNMLPPVLLSAFCGYLVISLLPESIWRVFVTGGIILFGFTLMVWSVGFDTPERNMAKNLISSTIKKRLSLCK